MRHPVFMCALFVSTALVADEVSTNNVATGSVSTNEVAAQGVRNPFWPMGYEGEREVISAEVHKPPKPAKAKGAQPRLALTAAEKAAKAAADKAAKEAAEKAAKEKAEKEAAERAEAERKKREITGSHWDAARKALKFGGRVKLREDDASSSSSVVINGKVYADGDLISITHDSRRFTWRIEGLSDKNKLKLVRLRAKYLEQPGKTGKNSDKGANP
jgi:transcription elongation GreA/GreB family factor